MDGARTTEVGRLIAAARRASATNPRVQSLTRLADDHWRRAASLSGCPGRQRVALLHAEEYARAAFLASDGPCASVAVPQD